MESYHWQIYNFRMVSFIRAVLTKDLHHNSTMLSSTTETQPIINSHFNFHFHVHFYLYQPIILLVLWLPLTYIIVFSNSINKRTIYCFWLHPHQTWLQYKVIFKCIYEMIKPFKVVYELMITIEITFLKIIGFRNKICSDN